MGKEIMAVDKILFLNLEGKIKFACWYKQICENVGNRGRDIVESVRALSSVRRVCSFLHLCVNTSSAIYSTMISESYCDTLLCA